MRFNVSRRVRLTRIALGMLVLLILPFANGKPALFADTKAYIVLGGTIAEKLGLTHAGQGESDLMGETQTPMTADASQERMHRALSVAAARSPYYSFYLFLLATIGTFWLVIVVQALVAALLVDLLATVIAPERVNLVYGSFIVALAAFSTLPLYIGYMMPDLFTGLGIVAVLLLLVFPDRLSRWTCIWLGLFIAFCSLAHSTHIISMSAAAIAGGAVLLMASRLDRRQASVRVTALIAIACIGPFGAFVYVTAGSVVMKGAIHRPPFLMARVLEDGPGRSYLAVACAADENSYELCRYKDRDLSDSQAFLWAKGSPNGVFASADSKTRLKLIAEEQRFILSAVTHYPLDQLQASLRNIGLLLLTTQVDDVTDTSAVFRDPEFSSLGRLFPGSDRCFADPAACSSQLPDIAIAWIDSFAAIASLILTIGILAGSWRDTDDQRRAVAFALAIFAAVLANAVICGAVSGPFPRYETRVTWLMPLCLVGVFALRRRASFAIEQTGEIAGEARARA
ncbi:MAG: hypothetical protein JWM36_899 [Hyphomicrobiales bacterium]|nr:hypothetical protein [Hyphomicrobiales bacterium]